MTKSFPVRSKHDRRPSHYNCLGRDQRLSRHNSFGRNRRLSHHVTTKRDSKAFCYGIPIIYRCHNKVFCHSTHDSKVFFHGKSVTRRSPIMLVIFWTFLGLLTQPLSIIYLFIYLYFCAITNQLNYSLLWILILTFCIK